MLLCCQGGYTELSVERIARASICCGGNTFAVVVFFKKPIGIAHSFGKDCRKLRIGSTLGELCV
jgi:hypothetical protein